MGGGSFINPKWSYSIYWILSTFCFCGSCFVSFIHHPQDSHIHNNTTTTTYHNIISLYKIKALDESVFVVIGTLFRSFRCHQWEYWYWTTTTKQTTTIKPLTRWWWKGDDERMMRKDRYILIVIHVMSFGGYCATTTNTNQGNGIIDKGNDNHDDQNNRRKNRVEWHFGWIEVEKDTILRYHATFCLSPIFMPTIVVRSIIYSY